MVHAVLKSCYIQRVSVCIQQEYNSSESIDKLQRIAANGRKLQQHLGAEAEESQKAKTVQLLVAVTIWKAVAKINILCEHSQQR